MSLLKSIYYFLSKKRQTLHLDYPVDFKPRFGHGAKRTKSALYPIVDKNRAYYKELLGRFNNYSDVFQTI